MNNLSELVKQIPPPLNTNNVDKSTYYILSVVDFTNYRKCSKCKHVKSVNHFAIDRQNKSGHSSICKQCRNEYQKIHPGTRRLYQKTHPEKYIKRFMEWRERNPARHWTAVTLISHRKRGFEVNISNQQLYDLITKIHNCQACGKPLKFNRGKHGPAHDSPTMDRMNNEKILTPSNILILCLSCNASKSEKPYRDFLNQPPTQKRKNEEVK